MAGDTLCLINQKGGCGKSSTCFHLAGAYAASGRSVLLIDADPQGSLSRGFFGAERVEGLQPAETLAALFDRDCGFLDPKNLIRPTGIDGISIVPANQHLAPFNAPSPERCGTQQYALRDLLDDVSSFDVVLIDCPPNLYLCSWAAMISSDLVLIPVPPEDFGTQGLRAVHQCIDHARVLNPGLRRLGHLVTRRDRRLLIHRLYESRLREVYHQLVLGTVVPEASAFKVSLANRRPVEFFHPRSTAANAMRDLVSEIDSRTVTRRKRKVAC